jgi:hypothetical protein
LLNHPSTDVLPSGHSLCSGPVEFWQDLIFCEHDEAWIMDSPLERIHVASRRNYPACAERLKEVRLR